MKSEASQRMRVVAGGHYDRIARAPELVRERQDGIVADGPRRDHLEPVIEPDHGRPAGWLMAGGDPQAGCAAGDGVDDHAGPGVEDRAVLAGQDDAEILDIVFLQDGNTAREPGESDRGTVTMISPQGRYLVEGRPAGMTGSWHA